MFGLKFGEVFLIVFIFLAVILAPYSSKLGGKLALLLRSKH